MSRRHIPTFRRHWFRHGTSQNVPAKRRASSHRIQLNKTVVVIVCVVVVVVLSVVATVKMFL